MLFTVNWPILRTISDPTDCLTSRQRHATVLVLNLLIRK